MKKFYTMLAIAAVAGVSVAAPRHQANVQADFSSVKADQEVMVKKSAAFKNDRKNLKAITSVADLVGDYDWTFFSLIDDGGPEGMRMGSLTVEASTEANKVTITGLCPKFIGLADTPVFEAVVDLQNKTLSIPFQEIGMYGPDKSGISGLVVCEATRLDVDPDTYKILGETIIDALVGTINEDGVIEFNPFETIRCGFEYTADGKTQWGGFLYAYGNEFAKESPVLDHTGWKDCGKAQFTDGWIIPAYTEDSYTWDVTVEQNVEEPTVLRLVTPYAIGGGMPAELNEENVTTSEGCIMFDIANPNAIPVIPGTYSGFKFSENPGKIYCSNVVGYYMYSEGFSAEDLIESLEPEELSSIEGNTVTINECLFGYSGAPYGTASWQSNDETPVPMIATIVLPDEALSAVSEVEMEDAYAPVEYYNLQGVKLAYPEKGSIVIVKQGSRVEKAVVR